MPDPSAPDRAGAANPDDQAAATAGGRYVVAAGRVAPPNPDAAPDPVSAGAPDTAAPDHVAAPTEAAAPTTTTGPGGSQRPQPEPPAVPRTATPGTRQVLLIAAIVIAIVFAFELASRLVPAVGDLFAHVPVTIGVLVAGTLVILLRLVRGRPED